MIPQQIVVPGMGSPALVFLFVSGTLSNCRLSIYLSFICLLLFSMWQTTDATPDAFGDNFPSQKTIFHQKRQFSFPKDNFSSQKTIFRTKRQSCNSSNLQKHMQNTTFTIFVVSAETIFRPKRQFSIPKDDFSIKKDNFPSEKTIFHPKRQFLETSKDSNFCVSGTMGRPPFVFCLSMALEKIDVRLRVRILQPWPYYVQP